MFQVAIRIFLVKPVCHPEGNASVVALDIGPIFDVQKHNEVLDFHLQDRDKAAPVIPEYL